MRSINFMGLYRYKWIFVWLLFCVVPTIGRAQMFSADRHEEQKLRPSSTINIYAGVEPMRFKYHGESTTGGGGYAFKGDIVQLGVELPVVKLHVGLGAGLDNLSYFEGGIRLGYGLPLFGNRQFSFFIPVQLQTNYISVGSDNVVISNVPQFQQGTFQGVIGVGANARASQAIRFKAKLLPSYGYTFSTRERNGNGGIGELKGELRVIFDHLFGNAGLSLGYDYTFRQFNVEGQLLDYRSYGNSFLVGVTF